MVEFRMFILVRTDPLLKCITGDLEDVGLIDLHQNVFFCYCVVVEVDDEL